MLLLPYIQELIASSPLLVPRPRPRPRRRPLTPPPPPSPPPPPHTRRTEHRRISTALNLCPLNSGPSCAVSSASRCCTLISPSAGRASVTAGAATAPSGAASMCARSAQCVCFSMTLLFSGVKAWDGLIGGGFQPG